MTSDPQDHHHSESAPPIGAPDPEEAELVPPRFRWLKRLTLTAACFLLGSVGLNIYATHHARSRLDALIERHRAAGVPVYPQDIPSYDLPPPEDNAATLYWNALNGLPQETVIWGRLDSEPCLEDPWSRKYLPSRNPNTSALLRKARVMGRTISGRRMQRKNNQSGTSNLYYLLSCHSLAKHIAHAAVDHVRTADSREAIELLHDLFAFSCRVLGEDQDAFVVQKCGFDCLETTTSTIEAVLPNLNVLSESEGDAANLAGPARPRQVKALIDAMLHEKRIIENWTSAVLQQRARVLDSQATFDSGQSRLAGKRLSPGVVNSPVTRFALRPLFIANAIRSVEALSDLAEMSELTSYQQKNASASARIELTPSTALVYDAASVSGTALRNLPAHFIARANCRMAAVALAIRGYECEHGHKPAALSDLVPDYLDAVPIDPFASDGRQISYLPDAERPMLYSVYLDDKDDGGAHRRDPSGMVFTDSPDWPFMLDGCPRAAE